MAQMNDQKTISVFDFSDDFDPRLLKKIKSIYNLNVNYVEKNVRVDDYLEKSEPNLIILNTDDIEPAVERFIIQFKNLYSRPPLLFLLSAKKLEELEKLIDYGIDDFILKPIKESELFMRIRKIVDVSSFNQAISETKQYLQEKYALSKIIGRDPIFLEAIKRTEVTAKIDAPVLLFGETGTGKELFARAIHYLSPRSSKPYIAVNCGAIPIELFENELFGHAKGAYTDARKAQKGYIAEAEEGTLFLDEINSMPATAQVKLLRFLQEHEYKPLGENKAIKANVRIVAASNVNLSNNSHDLNFRKDLLYRLDVFSVKIPPLRHRITDIPLLVNHFIKKYSKKYHIIEKKVSTSALYKLMSYDWPGNIRELENVIQKSLVLCAQRRIDSKNIELPNNLICDDDLEAKSFTEMKTGLIEKFEKNYITNILTKCDGNVYKAAKQAKMDRKNFYRLMNKYNISREMPA